MVYLVAQPSRAFARGKIQAESEAVAAGSQSTELLQHVRQARAPKRVHLHTVIGHETQAHAGNWSERAQMEQGVAVGAVVAVFTAVRHEAEVGLNEKRE